MGVGAFLFSTGVMASGWHLVHWKPRRQRRQRPPRPPRAMTTRELCGLVDVDYTEDLILVSPRGVELPYSPDWELDDVLEYLCEVDAL